MLGFARNGLLRLSRSKATSLISSIAVTHDPISKLICFFSSEVNQASVVDKGDAFTKSYLINSCGLSPDAANRASKKLYLKSADKPDAVLQGLRLHGFSDTQIANLVEKHPLVLLAYPERTLIPKIQLLASLGAAPEDVAKIIIKFPTILQKSLDRRLAPSVACLKSLFRTDEKVVQALLRFAWLLRFNVETSILPNVAVLRDLGMPEHVISECLRLRVQTLFHSSARFVKVVERVKGMGFDPTQFIFIEAMSAICQHGEEKWEQKCAGLRKWGWSENELSNAFIKGPRFMTFSLEKIDKVMDLIVNTMGFSPSSVAEFPWVILYSMKRLAARCSVIQILEAKGIIKRANYKISIFVIPEAQFLRRFVTKHEDTLPELLNVYCKALKANKPFQVCQPA